MAGESKQIYQLTSGTFNGSSLVPFEVPNTDPSTSTDRPYITRKTTGDEVSEFVAKTQEFETDLQTTDKHIVGAINEVNSKKADLSLLSDIKRIETEVTGQTCAANACIVVHYTIAVPEGYKVIGGYDSSYFANVIATPISLRDDGNMYFNYFSTSAFSNRTLKATIILAKNINR